MPKYQAWAIVKKILNDSKIIAVVGLSDKIGRPSHKVASYLQKNGYKIIPVNPGISGVLGEKSYPNLESIPRDIDVTQIFRKSEDVVPVVESAIAKGTKAIWLQEGIVNNEAAGLADRAGIDFIMNLCMLKEHKRHGL
jgi:predicted CoA-binding protein